MQELRLLRAVDESWVSLQPHSAILDGDVYGILNRRFARDPIGTGAEGREKNKLTLREELMILLP